MIKVVNGLKKINGRVILQDINIEFEKGKYIYISGVNGSGKTTLLKICARLMRLDKGEVITEPDTIIEYIDDKNLMIKGTIFQNLKFYQQVDKQFDRAKFLKLIRKSSFTFETKVEQLSKGQRALIKIFIVFSSSANIVFIDELLNGLDVENRKLALEFITEEKQNNRTVVIVDHNEQDLLPLVDIVYEFNDGKIEKGSQNDI